MHGPTTREPPISALRLGVLLCTMGLAIGALVAFTREPRAVTRLSDAKAVGFTVMHAPASRATGRSIPMAVWYPALPVMSPRLRVGDYIALADSDASGRAAGAGAARDQLSGMLQKRGAARSEVDRWMNALLTAHRDAPRIAQRAPLVLMAVGNDAAAGDLAVLAERLALHGYLVAAAPFPTRTGVAPMESDADVARVAEAQANDLGQMIRALGGWSTVDTARLAVVGHSFGTRGGLLLAMRDRRVRALVSLDGGIGSATGLESMRGAPSFAPTRPGAAILHVYETLDSWMRPDRALLQELDSTAVWLAATRTMHHHHFTSLGAVPAGYTAVRDALGHTGGTAHEFDAVATLVIRFLDANMQGSRFSADMSSAELPVERLMPRARKPQGR